jgi:DNA invertase Pin-like site-specific DNA recombinase
MKRRSNRVIAYTRVSTEEQSASGLGLVDQRQVIDAEVTRRGWGDVAYVTDEGFSAKSLSRPGITAALADLEAGRASTLVVSKLDRLSRSLLDFCVLMETSKRQGWEIVVLDLALDTSTPAGMLMGNVMASFSQYERQLIGARTSAALQVLKSQGVRLGRPRVMDASVSARIVKERQKGRTMQAIADGLNSDAVPTARGGTKWYPSTVKGVLTSAELDALVA